MLTLAGVGVTHVGRDVRGVIDSWLTLDSVRPFVSRSWPGPGTVFLSWPTGYRDWPPPLKLNHLWWPRDASRWAWGCYVIDNKNGAADYIHDQAFGSDGTKVQPIKLHIESPLATDGTLDESVDVTQMYVMAIIPMKRLLPTGQDASDRPMNLFVVADQRIFWWDVPCPEFNITEGGSVSWRNLIDSCAQALGVGSIGTSKIPADYLQPSRALNLTNEPIPPVLDSIAYNLGMRVVVGYDGTVQMQNFSDAKAAFDKDWSNNPGRDGKVLAGDFRFNNAI